MSESVHNTHVPRDIVKINRPRRKLAQSPYNHDIPN